jgi:phosphoribosylglycinamide formyltransferase-1
LVERYGLLNLHPALPDGPVGTWQSVIWELIQQGARESGVMVHRATADLDRGPPVAYARFPIRGGAFDSAWAELEGQSISRLRRTEGENLRLFRLIRSYGFVRETPLIISALRAFGEGRVRFAGQGIAGEPGRPSEPLDLTEQIDAAVAAIIQNEASVM